MSMFTFSHLKLTPAWPNYLCEITGRQNESSGCQRVAHTPRRDIATHTHNGVETLDLVAVAVVTCQEQFATFDENSIAI